MAVTDEEPFGMLKRVTGDFSDEVPEAGYRLVAKNLKSRIWKQLVEQANDVSSEEHLSFLGDKRAQYLVEFIFGFALAFVLELPRGPVPLQDQRRRLAYNIRIQAWQDVGDDVLDKFIEATQILMKKKRYVEAESDRAVEMLELIRSGRIESALEAYLQAGGKSSPKRDNEDSAEGSEVAHEPTERRTSNPRHKVSESPPAE